MATTPTNETAIKLEAPAAVSAVAPSAAAGLVPLKPDQVSMSALPPDLLTLWLPIAMLTITAVQLLGQLTFRRLAVHFAQEL